MIVFINIITKTARKGRSETHHIGILALILNIVFYQ